MVGGKTLEEVVGRKSERGRRAGEGGGGVFMATLEASDPAKDGEYDAPYRYMVLLIQ